MISNKSFEMKYVGQLQAIIHLVTTQNSLDAMHVRKKMSQDWKNVEL